MKFDLTPYLTPREWQLEDLTVGESRFFYASCISADEDGGLFAFLHASPRDLKEANNLSSLVEVRRDPDGFVLVLRKRNAGSLTVAKMPRVPTSRELFAPFVRVEEQA